MKTSRMTPNGVSETWNLHLTKETLIRERMEKDLKIQKLFTG
jgi:hypothetical protein